MHPPEHVVLGSVNHMFRLNHTPLEAMPQNEFIAISPDPCPWFTEGKGWQAVVHGNHLRKRSKDVSFVMAAIKAALRAVQLLLGKFPDLFRDHPIPAEANLPQLLLQADLQPSPNRVGHSRRTKQQVHHAEESFVAEVNSKLKSLLGETRQFVQKDQGMLLRNLHVKLKVYLAVELDLSALLTESQGGGSVGFSTA